MKLSTTSTLPVAPRYEWAAKGDANAFFGLMLDNIGVMILMASLLVGAYQMPREFVLTRMIPGTAVGVLVGGLIYTWMAFRLARRTGRSDITAMPLGLDTPSTFGTVFLIIGPSYRSALDRGLSADSAAVHAWFIGITMLLGSGVFKLLCAPFSGLVRKLVPRAGLLGSLTAIALVLISFLPLLDIAAQPVAGLVALGLMLATLTARWRFPWEIPGTLGVVVVGCLLYYVIHFLGLGPGLGGGEGAAPDLALRAVLPMPVQDWWSWINQSGREALSYMPVAIPLALATVVGGIDCTESAATVGDDYPTGQIIAAEGLATLVGGLFGGVIQSTPYIGHPAYKAMGGRAAYTLATALFVGAAGILGFFDWIFFLIPKAVIFPILIFVGLEMTSQSFHATPKRHYPAVALACVPALAYLAVLAVKQLSVDMKPFSELSTASQHWIQTVTVVAGGGGFIVTCLLWGTALAHMIDGRVRPLMAALLLAALFSWFGVIHSPLPSSPIMTPRLVNAQLEAEGRARATALQTPYHWAAGYTLLAFSLLGLSAIGGLPQTAATNLDKPDLA